ncbi:MAG: 8-oxoguanine deaminase [Paraglaciecola sp.]|jgi:8-oxoguanine deaminase
MVDTAHLAAKNKMLLHTHRAETEDENSFCLSRYGMRPLDYLEDCGLPGWPMGSIPPPDEIARLGQKQVGISHCPI